MLLNCVTKPDFIAYNHKYYWTLSRQICKKLYRNLAVAWTIKSQKELDARRKDFDLFIFDSFIPEEKRGEEYSSSVYTAQILGVRSFLS